MSERRCQETVGMVGSVYLRCNAPAAMRVQHRGRTEGPYDMCLECGAHNVSNRDAEVIEWFGADDDKAIWLKSGRTLP